MGDNESTLFLRNFTCIDHAYIDDTGRVQGGSYHQHVRVTGRVDGHEQVVVDFSKVKKQMKAVIDDNDTGFDHKLWIIEGYSHVLSISQPTSTGRVIVETPHVEFIVPQDAIKIIPNRNMRWLLAVERQMEEELMAALNTANPYANIEVEVKLTEETFGTDPQVFTYWHGLKNSSSWGCNNLGHGHRSFVECYDDQKQRVPLAEEFIAKQLGGKLLVWDDNIESVVDGWMMIAYTTKRGSFQLRFKQATVPHLIMGTETTVENIVRYAVDNWSTFLRFLGVHEVFISEGLQKGAVQKVW